MFLSFLLFGDFLQGASINIVTKFSKTGGLYGDTGLNTVGDRVNGREICASANNNSNDVPGCDMEQDPGYNNNGTDDDITDDYYTGDLIVRTNDIFQVKVGWNGTGVTNPITLSSTLPSFGGKNYLAWEKLPSSCKDGSSISDDMLSLVCVRTNDASISYSEDSPFNIKVRSHTPNNIKTGEISFSISSDGLETKTDSTDGYELTVTAKPMWNIQKKHVETLTGQVNANGDEGYIIRYAYVLEADEVQGEVETSSAVLGNEALGKNFSLSFTDDVSQISPNAEYIDCSITGAEGSSEPYPWYHADAPKRSVGSLESDLTLTCSQGSIGGDISIEYSGIDASMEHIATRYANGGIIPLTRLPIASGTIDIFVPIDDIKNATSIGNDSFQLDTNNTITSFDPISISGQSNFGALSESTNDNSVPVPLIYRGPGYTGGVYRKYFSNSLSLTPLPDTTNSFYSADGIVTPDKAFAAWTYVSNSGNKDFNDTVLCDVIDSNLYDVVDIEADSAVKLYSSTASLTHTIEYATGYVNSWPPALNQDNSANVIDECKDASVQWYATTGEARANGEITKVRLKIPAGLPAGKSAGFIINLKARSKDLSGTTIPSGTNLVNYSALHDSVLFSTLADNWHGATRVLNSYPTPATGGDYRADRAIMTRAKVRTVKELSTTIVEPSDEVKVKIESTFTTESQTPESSNVKVTEMLAPGLKYVVGSANIGDPTVGTCDDIEGDDPLKSVCTAEHQILIWDLGLREANSPLEDIEYSFVVSAFTSSGESSTYTIISSPTDTSYPNVRKANRNVSVTIPASLFITKEVNTPYREINQSPIEFTSYARNGSAENLTNIDMIDILPFNGDGKKGFTFTVASTVVDKKRDLPTSFNGTLSFLQAEGGHACSAGVTWRYTNREPSELDIAPTDVSNKAGGTTTWCEGNSTGPDAGCGYTNDGVTAVRLSGPSLSADATCSFKVQLTPSDNKKGDVYTNTASAFAQGVTLPTLSNDVSAFIPTTLLGDYVWIDVNANGLQDDDEVGAKGITLELLDASNTKLREVVSDKNGKYSFDDLSADTEYKIKAVIPSYYAFTTQGAGTDDKKDSDVDASTGITIGKKLNDNQQYRHFDIGLVSTLTISGRVYKQEDNSSMEKSIVTLYRDENADGILDVADTKLSSKTIINDAEYRFTNIFNDNYLIKVSKDVGFSNEYTLLGDELLSFDVNGTSVINQDFRFDQLPTVSNITHGSTILNFSSAIELDSLGGIDSDGDIERFIITEIPDASMGTLFLANGQAINIGDELTPEEMRGLTFKPNENFEGTATFEYKTVDNNGFKSNLAGVFKILVRGLILSGNVYDDGNGDNVLDTDVSIAKVENQPLYITLVDSTNTIIDFQELSSDGNYSFVHYIDANSTYNLLLTTEQNSTTVALPTIWNTTGEHIGTGAGLDNADGKITVIVAEQDISDINFAINKKPVAKNIVEPEQFNPSGIAQVDVPDVNISDKEDGTPTLITITSLPSNGTLYYKGNPVTVDQNISNLSSGELTLDPDSGEQSVVIKYTTTDRAGVVSDEATITMPFKDLKISGNLYIDGNGDGNVNGVATTSADGTQLYVSLVEGGTAVASMPLNSDGTYAFDIKDGVKANTSYTVVLSDSNGLITPSLPTDWDNNDGENINSLSATGNDGSKDGILTVNVVESDVTKADFAINKKPNAEDVTEPTQPNPGNNTNVQIPDLNISDEQTTNGLIVTITSNPNNATIYYNGNPVTIGDPIENFDNSLLTLDPDAGDQNVTFDYTVTDEAGSVSDPATVSLSFSNIVISGTLFNDGNGNGNVDGNETDRADTNQLFVTLLDSNGTEVASKPLANDGMYYFDSVDGLAPNSNYTIVLTDTLHKTTAVLPANWNNADGENIGLVGLDGRADGVVAVDVLSDNIPEINFGINKKPVAEDKTEASQFNPGKDTQVSVADLNISDREDGVPTTVTITTLPTNGTLYYQANPVTVNTPIVDADVSGFTFNPNDGDLTALFNYTTTDRAGVVSEVAKVTMPFRGLKIAGNIFNDGDNDGIVNGDGISAPNGVQLYITLLDEDETVVASYEVNADGSYAFEGTDGLIANSNYRVVLSTDENGTTASLPLNWSNLEGEHIGTDAGTDGSNDGLIDVLLLTSDVVEVNFGINKKPVAGDTTEPLQLNPGTDVQVNVPDLNITDNEDSTPATVTIQTVPSHGTLYYDGVEVTAGQEISNFDNSLLTLDPENGDVTVSFTYTTTDAVGDESDVATVSMLFDGLEISGNIFNDGNSDNTVNGTKISVINITTTLYVTLLDANGSVMASIPINDDGSYGFTGVDGIVPHSNYTVVLSTEANATSSTLPTNWNHADGEHIGVDVGLDANADGKLVVMVEGSDVVEVNFGINEQPKAEDKRESLQLNPGKDTQVAVPTLEISDNEDGIPKIITIKTLPTNGILYYNGEVVSLNMNITDANLSNFTLNPINGDVNVTFTYTSTDVTGWESEAATVVMPFDGLIISGQVFMDETTNNRVDGESLTSTQNLDLYVNLVDSDGTVVAWVPLDTNGFYAFDATIGIVPHSEYSMVLSTEKNSTLATLPSNWRHSDADNNGTLVVSVDALDVTEVNFGVNKQPVVNDVVATTVENPDGDNRVQVPNLNIAPNEDGSTIPTTVTLSNLPNNGTLYYDGVAVTEGQVINNFNNALLMVDPDDANVVVVFSYTTTDDAGFESESATVTMTFSDPDTDGDGITNSIDLDDDNDGILDTVENNTSLNGGDTDGDGIPDRLDLDADGDGILDLEESNPNHATVDSDGNGVLDSTIDNDKDGVVDVADADDNNPTSEGSVTPVDTDNDGMPNFQDVDSDNDGLSDLVEGGTDASLDANTDGILDNQTDTDGDGISDAVDSDNGGISATTPDTDNDGIDNYRDLDSDGDTLLDVIEIGGTDANGDGQIDSVGTLISGINLPDENSNGTPDILEAKLQDDKGVAAPGEVVTIDLLANDSGEVDKGSVKLIIPENFNGTARLSPDGKTMMVDGEGEWFVNEKGILTFTPEDGFRGTPTPIQYQASNGDGTKVAVANVSIVLSAVSGVTTEACDCESYENSVSLFDGVKLFFPFVIFTLFGLLLVRKED